MKAFTTALWQRLRRVRFRRNTVSQELLARQHAAHHVRRASLNEEFRRNGRDLREVFDAIRHIALPEHQVARSQVELLIWGPILVLAFGLQLWTNTSALESFLSWPLWVRLGAALALAVASILSGERIAEALNLRETRDERWR